VIGAATARRLVPVRGRLRVRRALTLSPRARRRLLALALAALALASGYFLWLRDSFLVAVREVSVTGVTGRDAQRVSSALAAAARDGTTLHVDREAVERAADAFPTIRALELQPDFPHGMKIRVIEHRPAAILTIGARRVPVADDGSILAGLPVRGRLPTIEVDGVVPSRRLSPGIAFDAVRVAGATPAALAGRLESVARERRRGIVVRTVDGPELIFGGATRIAAKWAAATRVLADRHAAGADYVDLRIPERPAAGGLPVGTVAPVAPAGPSITPAPSGPNTGVAGPAVAAPPAQSSPRTGAPPTPAEGGVPAGGAPDPEPEAQAPLGAGAGRAGGAAPAPVGGP
jgi:cell division protein FtsQ